MSHDAFLLTFDSKFQNLLQNFAFLTAADHIFVIWKHDFETIAKPNHDFLHVF